jgi:hypothetical protein
MRTWIIAAALGIALLARGGSAVFAQAGSTGGTIGKQDKSVSGGDAEGRNVRAAKSPAQNPLRGCGSVVGVWAFSNGNDVVVNGDGGATANGWRASWTCQANLLTIRWPAFVDNFTLASDGRSLSGKSGLTGEYLTARRR